MTAGEEEVLRVERELQVLSAHTVTDLFGPDRASSSRLERSAYLLLSRIEELGPMTIREIAEAFRLDVSTVNRHTAALTRAGLVERIPDPAGGIARRFRLSGEGAARLAEHRAWAVKGLTNLLADWTPEERATLLGSLAHLNTAIEQRRRAVEG